MEFHEWEQLELDPTPRPPVLLTRNQIQVPQPAVEGEDKIINNTEPDQPVDQWSDDEVAPEVNSLENERQKQPVQRRLEPNNFVESSSPEEQF